MDLSKLGKFIAECRKEKHFTQKELGDKIGVDSKVISKWENGSYAPDISFITKLSEVLEVTPEELLKGKRLLKNNLNKKYKIVLMIIVFVLLFVFGFTTYLYKITLNKKLYNYKYYNNIYNKDFEIDVEVINNKKETIIILYNNKYISDSYNTIEEPTVTNISVNVLYNDDIVCSETLTSNNREKISNLIDRVIKINCKGNYSIKDLSLDFVGMFDEEKVLESRMVLNDISLGDEIKPIYYKKSYIKSIGKWYYNFDINYYQYANKVVYVFDGYNLFDSFLDGYYDKIINPENNEIIKDITEIPSLSKSDKYSDEILRINEYFNLKHFDKEISYDDLNDLKIKLINKKLLVEMFNEAINSPLKKNPGKFFTDSYIKRSYYDSENGTWTITYINDYGFITNVLIRNGKSKIDLNKVERLIEEHQCFTCQEVIDEISSYYFDNNDEIISLLKSAEGNAKLS